MQGQGGRHVPRPGHRLHVFSAIYGQSVAVSETEHEQEKVARRRKYRILILPFTKIFQLIGFAIVKKLLTRPVSRSARKIENRDAFPRSEMIDAYESRFGALRFQHHSSNAGSRPSTVVALGTGESAIEVECSSIILVSAEENYCQVVVLNDPSVSSTLVRSTFQSVEQTLQGERFIRVHRSYLINVDHVERVHREGRRFLVKMQNWENEVPVAKSRLDDVLKRLEV